MTSADQVWRAVDKGSFAVLSHVTPGGRPRSSGVMYVSVERHLYVVTATDSFKARHIHDGDQVAVTVLVRRGGLLSLLFPIPPATISFHARALAHPEGSLDIAERSPKLASALPESRRHGCILELVPEGRFLTYGIGVSLSDMRKPDLAKARVPMA